ncbi:MULTISPECIES: hypothetical protein [unclassified Haloferax]|uniref:hypothetical protein n=1 Tax=unclassified Haloferax TaxID=2625095 RepID=UPI00287499EE|nr:MULTISPECIES: hypothetical protein [unclassified Haloferax]MDS0243619.1 hypothetical protein [Haloferax sp. S2CR25]MDS0446740.1 hypothetical protein [Haloferax sp. S2CR25-2]
MIPTDSPIDRRTVLRTLGGVTLTSVAGCLDGSRGSGTTTSDQTPAVTERAGPLSRIAVEGQTIVVEIDADAPVEQVNLIQPNGELFGKRGLAAGARQVSFEIGTAYDPGEYRVVALDGEETVAEGSLSIQPDLNIVEMGIGRNQPEEMWTTSSDEVTDEAFVTVENRGTGPNAVTKLLFVGDVPYPSDEEGTNYADADGVSGIYDPDADAETAAVTVPPGQKLTLYSYRSPFAFIRSEGTSCKDEPQAGELEVVLETRVDAKKVSETYQVQYSASDEFDNCEITISEV